MNLLVDPQGRASSDTATCQSAVNELVTRLNKQMLDNPLFSSYKGPFTGLYVASHLKLIVFLEKPQMRID